MSKSIINSILKEVGLSASSFARSIGVHPTQIYDLQSGKIKSISQAVAAKIQEVYPRFNLLYLLTGEGNMYADDKQITTPSTYEIPLLDLDASAGFAMVDSVGDNSRRTLTLPKCDGAITIVGKSMDPTIHDGDIAVFDMVNSPSSIRPDGIYIVQYADDDGDVHLTVKRVKRSPEGNSHIRLSADNPEYGYEDVPLSSISKVAKVLYTITKLSY